MKILARQGRIAAFALVALVFTVACPGSDPGQGPVEPYDGGTLDPGAGGTAGGAGTGSIATGGRPGVGGAVATGGTSNPSIGLDLPKLDIVFIIDNSGSMREEIENLKANVPALIDELSRFKGGLPDLRIAVVTSNVGSSTGPRSGNLASCQPPGDGARFYAPPACGLDRKYLVHGKSPSTSNFSASLQEVLACMLDVGYRGCYVQQPLGVSRMFFDPRLGVPEQTQFIRPDAALLVVIISDDDDCSDIHTLSEKGHALRLKCALTSHSCRGRPLEPVARALPFNECAATPDPPSGEPELFEAIRDSIESLRKLKTNGQLLVSVIAGWPDDPATAKYELGFETQNGEQVLDLFPVCRTAMGDAGPALRLKAYADALGEQGSFHSICRNDLRPALRDIGRLAQTRMMQ